MRRNAGRRQRDASDGMLPYRLSGGSEEMPLLLPTRNTVTSAGSADISAAAPSVRHRRKYSVLEDKDRRDPSVSPARHVNYRRYHSQTGRHPP